jgi:hypothetical protein
MKKNHQQPQELAELLLKVQAANDVVRGSDDESKSRDEWVAEIMQAHSKTAEAVVQLGLTLTAAKKALPHGEWLEIFERKELPFTETVAQRLMKIAADHRLANAAQAQFLPTKWTTIYELTKLPENKLEQALTDGTINPAMTRKDAKALVKATKRKTKSPSVNNVMPSEGGENKQTDLEWEILPEHQYNAYLLRVEQAIAFAKLPYTGEVTAEIIDLAKRVAVAWNQLADEFERRSAC